MLADVTWLIHLRNKCRLLFVECLYLQFIVDAKSQPKTSSDVKDFPENEERAEVLLSCKMTIPVTKCS